MTFGENDACAVCGDIPDAGYGAFKDATGFVWMAHADCAEDEGWTPLAA